MFLNACSCHTVTAAVAAPLGEISFLSYGFFWKFENRRKSGEKYEIVGNCAQRILLNICWKLLSSVFAWRITFFRTFKWFQTWFYERWMEWHEVMVTLTTPALLPEVAACTSTTAVIMAASSSTARQKCLASSLPFHPYPKSDIEIWNSSNDLKFNFF